MGYAPRPPVGFIPAPPVLPYREGVPPPPGYVVEKSINSGLAWGGAFVLGVGYGVGLAVAMKDDFSNGAGWLAAPVAGPWLALINREAPCKASDLSVQGFDQASSTTCARRLVSEAKNISFMIIDGLVQVTGASLMIVGVATTQRQYVRSDLATVSSVVLRPTVAHGEYALSLRGAF